MQDSRGRFGDAAVCQAEDDVLARQPVVTALATLLSDPHLETPITVGIFGEWGSGKTSTMRLLSRHVAPTTESVVWFDAWHFSHQRDALWRALLLAIVAHLRRQLDAQPSIVEREAAKELRKRLDGAVVALYRSHEYHDSGNLRVNWKAVVPLVVDVAAMFIPAGSSVVRQLRSLIGKKETAERAMAIVERERAETYVDQILSLEQFQSAMREFVLELYGPDSGRRLYIFVDDLDRCLPDAALDVLEALKVFLDIPGCVFVFGIDKRVIDAGIRHRQMVSALPNTAAEQLYSPTEYLEKIVQIPFLLPPLSPGQLRDLIEDWTVRNGNFVIDDVVRQLVLTGVAANPRKVKRTLNVWWLAMTLRAQASRPIPAAEVELLAKLTVLQTSFEQTYQRVKDSVRELKALEASVLRPSQAAGRLDGGPSNLRAMLSIGTKFGDLPDDVVAQLLSASAVGHVMPGS